MKDTWVPEFLAQELTTVFVVSQLNPLSFILVSEYPGILQSRNVVMAQTKHLEFVQTDAQKWAKNIGER
jgi:hypothetical protein